MTTNENTPPATPNDKPDLRHVVEEALDAFWDVVAENYPLAEAGDLSPLSTVNLDDAAMTAAEEWVRNNVPVLCKTCGGEIAETVNDSNFGEGECGPCEYRRYASQPLLVDAANLSLGFVCSWEKEKGVTEPTTVRRTLEDGLARANGNAV
jgi:hypothetical protein